MFLYNMLIKTVADRGRCTLLQIKGVFNLVGLTSGGMLGICYHDVSTDNLSTFF